MAAHKPSKPQSCRKLLSKVADKAVIVAVECNLTVWV